MRRPKAGYATTGEGWKIFITEGAEEAQCYTENFYSF